MPKYSFMQKRQFIKDLVLTGIAMPLGFSGMAKAFANHEAQSPSVLAEDVNNTS